MDEVISLRNVSKKYHIAYERPVLLKSLFCRTNKCTFWALKNINLSVKKGETIGIIGENGSGKSTLLKIIAGITTPTKGEINVKGRVISLIELGAGFHPDLTGEENVYLNGALLGLSKSEIQKKYNKIVEFAGIGAFIDQPVRMYSSGMIVRLGFSIAIHLNPEVLLIDEVLAVGDLKFQRKCLDVFEEFRNDGKTVVFVGHDLDTITRFSNKTIFLSNGKIIKQGKPKDVVSFYYRLSKKTNNYETRKSLIDGVKIKRISLFNISSDCSIDFNQTVGFRVLIKYTSSVKRSYFGYIITDEVGKIVSATNTYAENISIGSKEKGDELIVECLQKVPFRKGKYSIQVHLFPEPGKPTYFDVQDSAVHFFVKTDQLIFTPVYIKPVIKLKKI